MLGIDFAWPVNVNNSIDGATVCSSKDLGGDETVTVENGQADHRAPKHRLMDDTDVHVYKEEH